MITSTVSASHDDTAAKALDDRRYHDIVQPILDGARLSMRRLARRCEYDDVSFGEMCAMFRLGHIDRVEFMAFCHERLYLVRRARERSIGV